MAADTPEPASALAYEFSPRGERLPGSDAGSVS